MTAKPIKKKTRAGRIYWYIHVSYWDSVKRKWRTTDVRTGLEYTESRPNSNKAKAFVQPTLEEYSYLEKTPKTDEDVDPDVELCTYLDYWLANKKDIRPYTHDTYECHVHRMKDYFCDKHYLVKDVTPSMLKKYFDYLLLHGKVNQKDGSRSPLSVRTVRDYKNILNQVFEYAVMERIITSNPVKEVPGSKKRNKDFEREMSFLKEKDAQNMLAFLDKDAPFLKPISFFGVYYGMRREEVLGLKWSAIDFKEKEIHINFTATGAGTIYRKRQTKTIYSNRTLPMTTTAIKCLEDVKREQEKNKNRLGNEYNNKGNYVFTKEDGSPYRPDYISKKFSKEMDKFGRPDITFHKLRHSCISWLVSKGWDIKKIQNWVGDADANTVLNVYAHYMKDEGNKEDKEIEEMSSAVIDLF